jgi:hydroxyacylglutathione hydrolase
MAMQIIADGVWQLRGVPASAVNVYLVNDVLIDAGTRWAKGRILSELRRHRIRMVALTHCHPDHQGVAAHLCKQRKVPLACHEADVAAMEGRRPMLPDNMIMRVGHRLLSGPAHPVERVLREGDEVAGFRVIHTPGHTPGHVIFFRDSDRVAIAGDLLANFNFLKWRPELTEPLWFFSHDPALNRRSLRKLIELQPRVVCFGHGPQLWKVEQLEAVMVRWERPTTRTGTVALRCPSRLHAGICQI